MIQKFYELSCDECGCGEHFTDNIKESLRQARINGWIITRGGKHYDSEKCRLKAKAK
jgi:hypothetical protein